MKKMIIAVSLISSISAFADQAANWTCTGDSTKISAQTPYLGEDSAYEQTLYTLSKRVDGQFNASQYSALFLSTQKREAEKSATISGVNEKSGSFILKIKNIRDAGDGAAIHDIGEGTLTYSHGPLSGNAEKVDCVRE